VKDSEKQDVTCVKLPVSTPESIAAWRASRGLTGVAEPLPDGLRMVRTIVGQGVKVQ